MTTDWLEKQVHALRTALRDDCGAGACRDAFEKAQAAEATLLASIKRMQERAQEDGQRRMDLAAALDSKDAEIARLQALVVTLADATQGLMVGYRLKGWEGDHAYQTALDALAAAGR